MPDPLENTRSNGTGGTNRDSDLREAVNKLAVKALGARAVATESIPGGLGPRTFFRLVFENAPVKTAIARIDAPEDESLRPPGVPPEPEFEPIRHWMESEGLPVPKSFGRSASHRIDLLEDLGTVSLKDACESATPSQRNALYQSATRLVPRIQAMTPPEAIPTAERKLDAPLFRYKAQQVIDWLLPFALGRAARSEESQAVLEGFAYIGQRCTTAPQRVAHRDFQSTNLYVRNFETGSSDLAMIDFQGAFLAPPEYDLVCLLRDPHVALPEDEVRSHLAAIRDELPDRPEASEFEMRFDLLTLTRCGKDLARYRYATVERGDTRYTEASLVKELEARGIGRPSTYASIIDTIQFRGYVEKNGTALVPTFIAFSVTKLMSQHFEQLDLEVKVRMRRNVRADLPLAIAQMSRHEEPALTANFHSHQADIPALDHASGAYHALERLAARVGAVELRAVAQRAAVLRRDERAFYDRLAFAEVHVLDLQFLVHVPPWLVETGRRFGR